MDSLVRDDLQVVFHPSGISHDSGFCYLYPVKDLKKYSKVLLFESNKIIGSVNNIHDQIRTLGRGLYSPWDETLFFSSSDNTDPRTNGRIYRIIALNTHQKTLAEKINRHPFALYNSDDYNSSLSNLLKRGAGLNSSIVNDSRLFSYVSETIQKHFKAIPENGMQIGPGGSLGVEFLLCAVGMKHLVSIDINPLMSFSMERFRETIQELFKLVGYYDGVFNINKTSLELPSVSEPAPGRYRVGSSTIEYRYPVNAESTGFPDESFDLIYSFAALEHVRKPDLLIQENMRLLKKGGAALHIVDLKDHRFSDRPLHFLCQSDEEWQRDLSEYIKGGQEHNYLNRWRHSEYVRSFKDAGFEVIEARVMAALSDREMHEAREFLSERYQSCSDDDLKRLNVAYLVRK